MSREKCENFNRCGQTGHYLTKQGYVRCECLTLEMNRRTLGAMYCDAPIDQTNLEGCLTQNIMIEGPLANVRRHIARVLLNMSMRGQSYLSFDAYRLIELFLQQQGEEEETLLTTIDVDLLIILVGFGDPRNRYLPELLLQAFSRRELLLKPTWVLLGMDRAQIAGKYGQEVATRLQDFRRVQVK